MPQIDASLFKSYDVRATVDRLVPAAVHLIGRALGSQAREEGRTKIVVARDGRLSSPELAQSLADGLVESGIDVLDIGLAPTPLLYFAAKQHADGCGAVVTGSHNPPQYNGIKLMLGGETIDGVALQALRARIESGNFVAGNGQIRSLVVAESYVDTVCRGVILARPLKVVVDCGSGVAGVVAPALFRRLGCEVIPLYCEVDGRFPYHHPDPQVEANLADLRAAVLEHGADVGLAFDGDGDRLGVVTALGQVIPGDRLLALFVEAQFSSRPGLVLYDVKSSRQVSRLAVAHGGRSLAIPTGHSHMKRALRAHGAALAGELSGHFAFAGWDVDDALYAGGRLLQHVAAGFDLDEQLSRLPQVWASPELQVPLSASGQEEMQRIAAQAVFPTAVAVHAVDGLRIEYPDGFGLIRASNTTPVLTLRIEADTLSAQMRIRDELAAAIAPLSLPDWNET